MLNNSAWDLHDMERFADALPLFEEALAEWSMTKMRPRASASLKLGETHHITRMVCF
jgi:hypothetical protein